MATGAEAVAPPAETPRAEAVLRPLATPPGVAGWLRTQERQLLAARADAERALGEASARGEPPNAMLTEAVRELARVLDDPASGAFPRLLRRPLRQLVPGSPACASFERLSARLIARAARAVALQPVTARVWAARRALDAAYAARFPTLLRRALDEGGIDDGAIGRLQLPEDAAVVLGGLERVATRMAGWAAAIEGDPRWSALEVAAGEPLTPAELATLTVHGLRERERLSATHARAGLVRAQLARHAAAHRARATDTTDDLAPIVRELLLAAVRLGEENAIGAADAPLWSWTLDGAARGRAGAWNAGDQATIRAEAAEAPAAASTLYIVPLHAPAEHAGRESMAGDGQLAWITPDLPAALRVWDARLELGAPIQGRIVLAATADATDPVVEHDLAALYEGTAPAPQVSRVSSWYRTAQRAELRLVARSGREWVARLSRRGTVQPTAARAWDANAGTTGAFRLLRPAPIPLRRDLLADVELLGEAGSALAGARTLEVRTGFAGDGRAWLRVPPPDDPLGRAALDRELALFEELARAPATALFALRAIGVARPPATARDGDPLPLYRRPLATGPGLGELTPAWLRDRTARLALVRAIARAVVAVHTAGAALGLVHPDAFAYGLAYLPGGTSLAPRAVLAHAPCATPLGLGFDSAWVRSAERRGADVRLTRLRVSAIAGETRRGAIATREADAAAFLRCALDLLALEALPGSALDEAHVGGTLRLAPVIAAHQARFAAPEFAVRLATLHDTGAPDALTRALEGMGGA